MPLHEEHRKRRGRNFLLAGLLLGLVVVFFLLTIFRLGANVAQGG